MGPLLGWFTGSVLLGFPVTLVVGFLSALAGDWGAAAIGGLLSAPVLFFGLMMILNKTRVVVDQHGVSRVRGPIWTPRARLVFERDDVKNVVCRVRRAVDDRHEVRWTSARVFLLLNNGETVPLIGGLTEEAARTTEASVEEALGIVDDPDLNVAEEVPSGD